MSHSGFKLSTGKKSILGVLLVLLCIAVFSYPAVHSDSASSSAEKQPAVSATPAPKPQNKTHDAKSIETLAQRYAKKALTVIDASELQVDGASTWWLPFPSRSIQTKILVNICILLM